MPDARALHDFARRVWHTLPWRVLVLVAVAALATTAFVMIAEEVIEGDADRLDTAVSVAIYELRSPSLHPVMIAVTYAGAGVTLAILIVLLAAYCLVRKHRWLAFLLVANGLGAYAVNQILKYSFARERPALFEAITSETSYSFPSAHAMSSMAVYGTIGAVVIALWPRLRWPVIVFVALLVIAIGFSRVYLGVHWPLDVIAGLAGGIPFVVVAAHLAHRAHRARRHGELS